MVIRDIQNFAEIRTKARAYFCYLLSKNLPNELPEIELEAVAGRLRKVMADVPGVDGVYILDQKGMQISPTYLPNGGRVEGDVGVIRSSRAYYYRAFKEKRCTLTDPYPSLLSHELAVTASKPLYDEKGELRYVACVDMPLDKVLEFAHPTSADSLFGRISKVTYSLFSIALAFVSILLFIKGVEGFFHEGIEVYNSNVKSIFESTILLTLSLAIFDLVKTIFDEEVMGRSRLHRNGTNKTMVKFLGSIIIALSIEALMLVFKFAITDPSMLIHAIYIIGSVALLIVALAFYIHKTKMNIQDDV
ncbi:MAG: membrane protein [Sulfurovum sp. PC08-66]|nr:MAG: membrane protein [Sulfurovum sp. PC08-66]KIM12417.1 MAG: membrane protein [Sulfuricurvum sp. PC08-66]